MSKKFSSVPAEIPCNRKNVSLEAKGSGFLYISKKQGKSGENPRKNHKTSRMSNNL